MHGYVMTLSTREGAAVTPDVPLFELVGHDPLWVLVNLPESQSASDRDRQRRRGARSGLPGPDVRRFDRLSVSGTGHEHAHAPRAHRARQSRRRAASRHVRRRVAVRAIAGRRAAGAERSGHPHRAPRRGDRRRGTRRISAGARRRRRRARRQNRHRVRARRRRPRGDVRTVPDRFGSEPAWRLQPDAGRRRTRAVHGHDRRGHPLVGRTTGCSCCSRPPSRRVGTGRGVAYAARRDSRSLRRAGDRTHHVSGAGAASGRGSGHLSADHDAAVGAARKDGARLFAVRRIVRIRAVRRRHRSVLGAFARTRVSVAGAGAAAGRRDRRRWVRMRPASAGSTNTHSSIAADATTSANCARCRTGS